MRVSMYYLVAGRGWGRQVRKVAGKVRFGEGTCPKSVWHVVYRQKVGG